jgi:hypothetical protein
VFNIFGELNWLALILATLAYYILGAVWFTPLFGKAWDTAIGFERTATYKFTPIYYIGPLISSLVVTVATAVLIHALRIERLTDAVVLGLIVGIGYTAAVSFNNAITPKTPRPLLLGAVTGAYHILGVVIVAAIVSGMS